MDRERIGRLLMSVAAVIALLGVPISGDTVQKAVLVVSGCLVMTGIGLLLLAPSTPTRTEQRARARRTAQRRQRAARAGYRVPQQRRPALTEQRPEEATTASRAA